MSASVSPKAPYVDVLVLALLAAALVWQLLIPPAIGLADNGDFPRISGRFAINYISDRVEDNYFRYAMQKFRIDPAHVWRSGYLSSESLLGALSVPLNRLLFHDGLFDIRALAVIHIALLLVAAWLLIVWSRRLPALARAVFLALLVLVLGDTGYICYFNSFYSEPASFVFLLIALGLLLLITDSPRFATLSWFLASALLFVCAKSQNAAPGILLSLLAARMTILRKDAIWRAACLAVAMVLGCSSIVYTAIQPRWTLMNTFWGAVFTELLGHSTDPLQDLADLGLSREFSPYAGLPPFSPPGVSKARQEQVEESLVTHLTLPRIGLFYLAHPARLYSGLERILPYALIVRPSYGPRLGNYDRSSGRPPYSISTAFSLWTDGRRSLAAFAGPLLVLFFAANAVAGVILHRRAISPRDRFLLEMLGALLVMTASQILLVTITMGTLDPIKQLFLFNVLLDACIVFDIVWLAERIPAGMNAGIYWNNAWHRKHRDRNRPPGRSPSTGRRVSIRRGGLPYLSHSRAPLDKEGNTASVL
jgi:hypothetical protein